jgi:hypothetical protein
MAISVPNATSAVIWSTATKTCPRWVGNLLRRETMAAKKTKKKTTKAGKASKGLPPAFAKGKAGAKAGAMSGAKKS